MIDFLQGNCSNNEETKVFSFGIGDDIDSEFLESIAVFGRGAFTQVGKDELSTFKPKLIHSLLRANLPALQNCSLSLGGQERILGELFENEVFNSY